MGRKWHNFDIPEILFARKYQNLNEEKKEKSLKIILSVNFCPTVIFEIDKYQQKPELVMDC